MGQYWRVNAEELRPAKKKKEKKSERRREGDRQSKGSVEVEVMEYEVQSFCEEDSRGKRVHTRHNREDSRKRRVRPDEGKRLDTRHRQEKKANRDDDHERVVGVHPVTVHKKKKHRKPGHESAGRRKKRGT